SGRPVLLADEPTGQLDAATTDTVLSVLFDRSHGRSVVVVTHDPAVASRCDRVYHLRNGVLWEAAWVAGARGWPPGRGCGRRWPAGGSARCWRYWSAGPGRYPGRSTR